MNFLKNIKDLILFFVAWLLIPCLHFVNLCINAYQQDARGFNYRTAFAIDVWAAYNYREIWNLLFITKDGYQAGVNDDETLSSILGENELRGTLTKDGKDLVKFLNWIDENHCVKARKKYLKC